MESLERRQVLSAASLVDAASTFTGEPISDRSLVPVGDRFEPNETRQTATDLGSVSGSVSVNDLSIDAFLANDADFFRFTTAGPGTSAHYVDVLFTHANGDLDARLLDASGNQLASSTGTTNSERLSLQGRPAGTYFLHVYGFSGARNDYRLAFQAPGSTSVPSDRFESNDTRQAATDLQTVAGAVTVADLSLHTTSDRDFYRFVTAGSGTSAHHIDVLFTHAAGDVDARLLDASGTELATSTGTTDSERLSLQGRPAGTYFLEVYGFSGARNSYRLSFQAPPAPTIPSDRYEANDTRQTATDLQTVAGAVNVADLSLHTTSDRDFYRFVTAGSGTSAHHIDVLFTHAAGDVDARLLDASGTELATSAGTADSERLSLQGRPAGTYFLEVYGFSGARNSYRLSFQAPPAPTIPSDRYETNDTRQTATDLGSVSGARAIADVSLHTTTDRDFYRFVTAGTGTSAHYVDVLFTHAAGDVDARLLDAAGTELASSAGTSDSERLSLQGRPAGTYFLEVFGFSGARNSYRVAFEAPAAPTIPGDRFEPNDTRQTATDLRTISGAETVADLSIHTATDRDFYRFVTTGTGTSAHYVDVLFTHAAGDVDARLLDASGTELASSAGTSDSERLSLQGRPAGTYFLEVFGFSGARNSYRLAFQTPAAATTTGDRFEPNDTRQTATDLRTISGAETVADLSIHTATDRDFYRFVTTGAGTSAHYVDVLFAHAAGDVDARLLDASGTELASSTGTADSERLSLQGRPAGTYFLEVYGFSGARNSYRLAFQTPATPTGTAGDRYEANDTRQTATDLRTLAGAVTVADLSIHTATDRDFYRFVTTGAGTSAHYVDVLFTHAAGDVDARLLDAAGTELASSTGTADSERLSLQGRPAGTYFLEVFGYSGARNSYRLALQAPGAPTADRYEPNDTRQTATDLRTISGSQSVADLSITANDRDFFQFTIAAGATATHSVQASFAHAAGNLEMRLLDAQGNAVRSSTRTTDNERISLEGLAAGTYVVEVYGATSTVTNSYALAFATPVASQPGGPTSDAWTIMVYMTADNLQHFAHIDVNEMERAVARLPGTVNLSVFWDQSSARTTYPTGGGTQAAWGTAGRAFITADSNMSSVGTTFEILPEANTGNPQTLIDFVNWSVQRAPAQRYAVILWDHGSGLEGFNYDHSDSGQPRDHLSTGELAQALTTLRGTGVSIDLLSFDACLMAMTEVGYATRTLASTFVAAQEIVGGDGHDYTTLFRALESDPYAVTASTLATGFVRSFGDQYLNSSWAQSDNADTHSAILASRYDAVVTALRSFTTAAAGATAADRTAMATARAATPLYGDLEYLRDLGGFMQRIANTSSVTAAIRTAATGVVNAVAQAVISKTADRRGSSGMSIYLPQLGSTVASWYTSQYAAFDTATGWSAFLGGATASGRTVSMDWSGATNNLAARAYDLGVVTGSGLGFDFLSLEGAAATDWFRFAIGQAGAAGNRVRVQSVGAVAPLNLELYDVAGTTRLAAGTSGEVSLAGLPAGQYAVRVASSGAVDRYRVLFDAPGIDAQTAVPNSTLEKAFELGVLASTQQFTGFVALGATGSTPSAAGWSYYVVSTAPSVSPQQVSLAVNTPQGVSLDVEITTPSGQPVASQSGTGAVNLTFTSEGAGEAYVLRVRQTPARSGGSAAAFNAVLTVARNPVAEDIALSATVVSENRPAGTVVGTLSAALPGANGGLTYTLVTGVGATDNAAFAISGNQLTTARALNFERQQTYSIRVRASDTGGQSTERSFTVNVTDVANEPLVVDSVALPAAALYVAGQPLQVAVTMSRRVVVSGRPELAVRTADGVRMARYVAGSGSATLTFQYVVGAADQSETFALGARLLYPAGSRIAAGAATLAPALPAGVAGAAASGVRIDGRPPRVVGALRGPVAGTYRVGQALDFVARFSEAVIVGGTTPRVTLRGMNGPRVASYVSGSGTTQLTFRYVVGEGDAIVSPTGLGLGAAISLPPGTTLVDSAGNRGLLAITAPPLRQVRIDTRVLASLAATAVETRAAPAKESIKPATFARLR